MKIKRELKIDQLKGQLAEPEKMSFMNWIMFSPKAYQITMIIAFVAPAVMFGVGTLLLAIFVGLHFSTILTGIFFAATLFNLHKWRWIFKFEPDDNIATAIYGKILGRKGLKKKGEEMLNGKKSN